MSNQIPKLKIPIWWQRIQWILDPVGYLEAAKREGFDFFQAEVVGFGNGLIFVDQPEAIQYIFTHDRGEFLAPGEANSLLRPLLGDFSVILLEGEQHKKRRRLLMPPFHGERLQVYGDLVKRITVEAVERQPLNRVFQARQLTQEISLQVIMQTVFGLCEGERYQRIKQLLISLIDIFRSPVSSSFIFFTFLQRNWGPWARFMRQRQDLCDLLDLEIEERRGNSAQSRFDILSLLMSARDESGEALTNQELQDELITLLFAGYETTASALAWALYWIHRDPRIKEKLLEDIAKLNPNYTSTDLMHLSYLNAVCNETLRIYPVAMLTFPRIAQKEIKLANYTIEPGTPVMGNIYLLHHREDLYPNPDQFRPERFLERNYGPYEFLPFGRGARSCIGEALSQFEMKLVLVTMLQNYEFALADSKPELPQRRGVTLAPNRGVPFKLTGYHRNDETANYLSSVQLNEH